MKLKNKSIYNFRMSRFVAAEVVFNARLTPLSHPHFQKPKMGERTGRLSP